MHWINDNRAFKISSLIYKFLFGCRRSWLRESGYIGTGHPTTPQRSSFTFICGRTYRGQTGRLLGTRFKKYRSSGQNSWANSSTSKTPKSSDYLTLKATATYWKSIIPLPPYASLNLTTSCSKNTQIRYAEINHLWTSLLPLGLSVFL